MSRTFWPCLLLMCLSAHAADTYRLDGDHARVALDVTRIGIQFMTAHFGELDGEFIVDRVGQQGRIDVSLRADSVECPDPEWNAKIRSKEWLDTQDFPEITYHSDDIELDDQGRGTAYGRLTLRGVTRPVTLNISRLGCSNGSLSPALPCDFVGYAHIKRSDFGLPHGFWLAGDDVRISIDGTGIPQPPQQ